MTANSSDSTSATLPNSVFLRAQRAAADPYQLTLTRWGVDVEAAAKGPTPDNE